MKYQNFTSLIVSLFAINFKKSFLTFLLFVMCSNITYSNIPAYTETIRIDSVTFVCDSVVFVGDTINLQVKFTSYIKDTATVALTYRSGLEIVGGDTTKSGIIYSDLLKYISKIGD